MDKFIRKNILDGLSVAAIGFVCCGIYTLLIHNIQRRDLSRTLRSDAGAMCMGFIILLNHVVSDFFQNSIHKISKLGMLVHRLL
jgi:acyl CoA:acetate/3-ketoacid CoA transferase alpha subunit